MKLDDRVIRLAANHCIPGSDAHGTKLTFNGLNAVADARRVSHLMVLDPTDTAKRVPASSLNDTLLANMLVLELRTAASTGQVGKGLPRRVYEANMPSSQILPQSVSHQQHPLDAVASALQLQEISAMSNLQAPDLAALMRDPKKLGEFLATAVSHINMIPKMQAQIEDANKSKDVALAAQQAASQLAQERADAIVDLEDRLKVALTKASQGSIQTKNAAGETNDLKALAAAMHIPLATLEAELQSFVETCSLPLSNPVRWPVWCDPTDKSSPLPFCYRNHKPVFLAGESGTGKTFIAEALCMQEAGRRCATTFHEKISYAKLFVRETVDAGKVRMVLGPVLLSMLTGTPLVLDEIDHADVFVQSLMHEILDKRRVFIPELALSIIAEKGCELIATGNSLTDDTGQYHGDVGTALRTRFAAIHVEYPSIDIEADTVLTASACPKPVAETIAKVFAALRGAVQEQKLAGPISVRESCAAGMLFVQAKQDKLPDDTALGLALSLMVVQKRPPQEQTVAAEICAVHAKVAIGAFQQKTQTAGQKARAGKGQP